MRNYRAFRKSNNMTQEALAELLKISQPHLALLESGRRDASRKVKKLFDALAGKYKEANLIPDTPTKKVLTDSNEAHLENSILYLESYRKDCESQLHRLEKQLKDFTDRNITAKVEIIVTGLHTDQIRKSKHQELIDREVEERKQRLAVSKSSLDYVLAQKPEIKRIKIEGLKEEIRKIKPMLARKKKMLKHKKFDSMGIPGMETSEQPVQDWEKVSEGIPGSDPDKEVTPPPSSGNENFYPSDTVNSDELNPLDRQEN